MAEGRNHDLENTLQECLEAVRRGEGVESCLARYPQQAQELRPLLEAALKVEQAFSSVEPHPYFRARTKYRLLAQPQKQPFPLWRRRWALALSPLVLALAMGGTVLAASGSLPDQPLYPVKQATEQVQLALTPSTEGKAQLQVKLVERRIEEMSQMAQKNKPEEVERAGKRMLDHLRQVQLLSPGLKGKAKASLKAQVKEQAPRHRQMLQQMGRVMPMPSPMMSMPKAMAEDTGEEEKDWEGEYQGFIEQIEKSLDAD